MTGGRRRDLHQGRRLLALRLPRVDKYGQVIDVLVSARRDAEAGSPVLTGRLPC
jgi:hypothetical protein